MTYQVRIENASPLMLNGLAVLGSGDEGGRAAQAVLGDLHRPAAEPDGAGDRGGGEDARTCARASASSPPTSADSENEL